MIRRLLPLEVRLQLALGRRRLRDLALRPRFATRHPAQAAFSAPWGAYELPLFDYPGQEAMGRAKRHNQALVAARLHGVVIEPGETLSLWRLVGRPTGAKGFLPATALKDGRLTLEVGGAVCFLSTVLYNAALLAGLTVVERRAHSVDTYGEKRYFELGRDATVEYGYVDLRFRNDHDVPLLLRLDAASDRVSVAILGPRPRDFDVEIVVSPAEFTPAPTVVQFDAALESGEEQRVIFAGYDGVRTTTRRVVRRAGETIREDDLGPSVHHPEARILARGPVAGVHASVR